MLNIHCKRENRNEVNSETYSWEFSELKKDLRTQEKHKVLGNRNKNKIILRFSLFIYSLAKKVFLIPIMC